MERRTFEDSFKDAFKDAEATPSDKVWTNVELELERESGSTIRRRLVFYQLLAAAAVTLALLSTGVAYFIINTKDQAIDRLVAESKTRDANANGEASLPDQRPADATTDNTRSQNTTDLASNNSENNSPQSAVADKSGSLTQRSGTGDERLAINDTQNPATGARTNSQQSAGVINNPDHAYAVDQQGIALQPADQGTGVRDNGNPVTTGVASIPGVANQSDVQGQQQRVLPAFYTASVHQPALTQPTDNQGIDPVAAMMSKLAEQELKLASNDEPAKDFSGEKVWTALGIAAGGFSAVNHSAAPSQSMGFASSNNASVADKQSRASGVAYSLGVSFGTKVARRWVVHGGVNYLTQSSNYVANNVVAGPNYTTLQAESINALGKLPELADAASADRLAPTVPYSVNNNLKYFSLPMQAGYLLVNRKFGVQLNAGISTDLFLENTITPEGGSLDKTTQSSGSESPYRTVNFSGLMGTEFSYRLGQRYRIALNPALRYPLNSVYKSDMGIESMPLTFDVGLRFRYIFK